MKTRYEDIVDVSKIATREGKDLQGVIKLAQQEDFTSALDDGKKVLLLLIDPQNDFMENIGSLGVKGSIGDVSRITDFIYRNNHAISRIMCTQDTHFYAQIFHPCWWEDEEGNNPDPYTIITYDDYKEKMWAPVYGNINKSEDYLAHMNSIQVWPYHCLEGSFGGQVEGELAKMIYFWSVTRKVRPIIVPKGNNKYSEMFGVIKGEYDSSGYLNHAVLNAIEKYDEIYVAGEAGSHCLPISVQQIIDQFAFRPEITSKFTILEDCTSPVVNCEKIQQDFFNNFNYKYGIRIAKARDIQL